MQPNSSNANRLSMTLAFTFALALPVYAEEHVHGGDILPELENGRIVLHTEDFEFDFGSGAPIYEADFGDPFDPDVTDEPGYDHEDGQFDEGTLLAVVATGGLQFWDGATWSPNTNAVISIEDASPARPQLAIDASGAPAGAALIAAADAEGNIHIHRDFSINADAEVGAYLITLQLVALLDAALNGDDLDLSMTAYEASSPFMLIFNRGLLFEDFEASVEARVVPLPGAAILLGSALLGLVGARRRAGASGAFPMHKT